MIEAGLSTVRLERQGAIATLILNRPQALNALNAVMFDELEAIFQQLAGDRGVRAVLVTGAGDRAFAAGADIRELLLTDADAGRAVSERGQRVFDQIEGCGKPVIACINGVALGGGCELALACTLRIAGDQARIGLPELKLGLIPGYGGTQRLVALIGRGPALHMMLTGRSVNAETALRLGLVNEVVPGDELLTAGHALAQTIANMAPLAVAGLLEAVQRRATSMQEGLAGETGIFARLCGSADKEEGLAAFLEKRPAVWQGR